MVAFKVLTEVCHMALNVAKARLAAKAQVTKPNVSWLHQSFLKCLQWKQFQCFFSRVLYLEE